MITVTGTPLTFPTPVFVSSNSDTPPSIMKVRYYRLLTEMRVP